VVITPHAAYYSEEAIRTVRDFAAHEVSRVLTGQPPLSPAWHPDGLMAAMLLGFRVENMPST
jgi:phosphoglycerate dehydrogenase-like enzyme